MTPDPFQQLPTPPAGTGESSTDFSWGDLSNANVRAASGSAPLSFRSFPWGVAILSVLALLVILRFLRRR